MRTLLVGALRLNRMFGGVPEWRNVVSDLHDATQKRRCLQRPLYFRHVYSIPARLPFAPGVRVDGAGGAFGRTNIFVARVEHKAKRKPATAQRNCLSVPIAESGVSAHPFERCPIFFGFGSLWLVLFTLPGCLLLRLPGLCLRELKVPLRFLASVVVDSGRERG